MPRTRSRLARYLPVGFVRLRSRAAFTLLELLISLGIVAMLFALTLGAVLAARASALSLSRPRRPVSSLTVCLPNTALTREGPLMKIARRPCLATRRAHLACPSSGSTRCYAAL